MGSLAALLRSAESKNSMRNRIALPSVCLFSDVVLKAAWSELGQIAVSKVYLANLYRWELAAALYRK